MKDTPSSVQLPAPTSQGVEALLAGPYTSGLGKVLAARLVERFGSQAVDALLNDPQAAAEVAGMSAVKVEKASQSLRNLQSLLAVLLFLYSCGLSDLQVERIIDKYKLRAADVALADPYSMVEDAWQFSFYAADKIGECLEIAPFDLRRLRGAALQAVKNMAEHGHLFATRSQALEGIMKLTNCSAVQAVKALEGALEDGRLIESRGGYYLPVYYESEKQGAERIKAMTARRVPPVPDTEIPEEDSTGRRYSKSQQDAIKIVANNPVSVITGGPGTGKTTVMRSIVDMMEKQGKKVVQVAPTGRAAKRMEMLTGRPASTIHRLLGFRMGEGYRGAKIETDVLIIDEGSMLEQVLFNHLLRAVDESTRLVVVGDTDQLPAIGAGNVMQDMIASGVIPVAKLSDNFRQSEGSMIAAGASAINAGKMPDWKAESDFIMLSEKGPERILNRIVELVVDELPQKYAIEPNQIVVVSPQQMGPLGARRLNALLQERVNAVGPALQRGGTTFRLGDPVMQTANSRQRGVYNGETGRIVVVDTERQALEVEFSDGRRSRYERAALSELTLAYSTTVHKLQGSEAEYIVMPITMLHKPMLYRNLLYTGVSRASKLCVLVGQEEALRYCIDNVSDTMRNSNFGPRLLPAVI